MKADRQIIRTNNFVTDAAAFIHEQACKAVAERNEFRIALSGGNTPAPVYARVAAEARDFLFGAAAAAVLPLAEEAFTSAAGLFSTDDFDFLGTVVGR